MQTPGNVVENLRWVRRSMWIIFVEWFVLGLLYGISIGFLIWRK